MPIITLPDGSQRRYPQPVTAAKVAADIGPGLARAALAARVNDELVDLSREIAEDARIAIVTDRDPAGLEVLRHSTAHLLAQAVKELFPDAQVTIGPVIEDGFYYDFAFERGFTPEDLARIEGEMRKIVSADYPVVRTVVARDEAVARFRAIGEEFKAEITAGIPSDDPIGLYT
ncbi:MAG TPA: TGS domain-containing protein, partial [Burkholderiales bacterium]